jgi:CBS domain containing-hemolysin-like protein
MLIGELAPKNYAIAKPEKSALAVSPSMLWFLRLAGPVIRLFDGMANWTLERVGIEPADHVAGGVSSVAELDLIVGESAQHGQLTSRQANLLRRAIDFAALRASAVMIPWNRVSTLPPELSGEELREVMAGAHSRYPVVDDRGMVLGTVHVKDLLHIDDDDNATISVGEIARPSLVVPEVASVRTVLDALRTESTEMAIVVDEYGAPAGIVTLEDLVEELVGEIGDEYDEEEDFAPIRQTSPGVWRLAGTVRVDEVERATGIALPDGENFETVAGLVLERLQRVPVVGDRVQINESELVVAAMDHWSIEEIELSPAGGSSIQPDDER